MSYKSEEAEYEPQSVASGSAVRVRYFDRDGALRTAVILSTVPVSEVKELAQDTKLAVEAYVTVLGGAVLDVSVDLEDRDQIVAVEALPGELPPVRGAGFLQLATVHGKSVSGQATTQVDLVITEADDGNVFQPTNIGSIYG